MTTAKNTTRKTTPSGATVSPIRNQAQRPAEWPPKHFGGFNFSASPIYTLRPAASHIDVHDQLNARMTQLVSMTTIITAEGADVFHDWSPEIQDGYECKELSELL